MQAIEDEDYEDLDDEYNMYQDQHDGMTQQEYEDLYGQPTEVLKGMVDLLALYQRVGVAAIICRCPPWRRKRQLLYH
jgi:hypothetical protein